ncbi:uncharacterized protein Z519_02535 [Cladophialophora bantiana CBS 173.52]|uniref:SNF2 family helicase/ATPase n=1 Tax=Cladophialophora bantiana (strain ATCC 10958 / CBS 173.52 / CDC B-1940 / NIH 8579) TaxID=1442370 RepID=A0A0D2HUU6_CLAB1|nr:uncharacterized protein Z519_02535 [Cladophialophora bantiana CBS 173.52]KIW97143.1 hypothetical protein Z519_02535 [Cladophialophora bantiana CBS 173.52]
MDAVLDVDDDPRNWSIDQIVSELCQSTTPRWLSKDNPQLIPDRHCLEDALRRNHVDGDNLLALDMATLKEDLGIPSFGQRRAIMRAVEFFRRASKSYQQMVFQADSIARMQSATYASPQITQSRISVIPQSPVHCGLGVQPSIEAPHHFQSPSLTGAVGQQRVIPVDPTLNSSWVAASNLPDPTVPTVPTSNPHTPDVPQPKSSTAVVRSIQNDVDGGLTSESHNEQSSSLPQRPAREYTVVNGKKRIAPTFISRKSIDDSYLGRNVLRLQDFFYHKIPTGLADNFLHRVAADEDKSFHTSDNFPAGQRRTVARVMQSFLRRSSTILQGYQSLASAIDLPESAQGVTHHISSEAERGGSHVSYLNYLAAKYADDDSNVLPVYGDSGDEGDFDEELWREIEEEQAEKEALRWKPANMTPAEVEAAINEAIHEWKQEWRETKFLAVQRKAYRHWMNAARNKSRRKVTEHFNHLKNHFQQRMDSIKREIAGEVWRNPADVKRQCQSLELTVYHHQEYDYYVQVMLRDTPPERPSKEALKAVRAPKQRDLEEGEELLESESETALQEDGDSFVNDSSDAGSIHHVSDTQDWNPIVPNTANPPVMLLEASPQKEVPADVQDVAVPDIHANDADVESETDAIITPARRRKRRTKTEVGQTPNSNHPVHINPKLSMPRESSSETSDLDRSPRLPKSRYRNKGRSTAAPIDLTFSSASGPEGSANPTSTDFSVRTPILNPVRLDIPKKNLKKHITVVDSTGSDSERTPSQDDTSLPGVYDVAGLRRTSWSSIDPIDKRRALAKAVYDLDSDTVTSLASFVKSIPGLQAQETVIIHGLMALGADEGIITGVKPKYQLSARLLVSLYLTYICGQNALEDFELSEAHRDQAFEDKDSALEPFFDLLGRVIRTLFRHQKESEEQTKGTKRKRDQDSFSVPETLYDSDEQMTDFILTDPAEEAQPSSHKKRKRKVEESQEAISQQFSDKVRIQEQEERRKAMAKKLALMQVDGNAAYIVNTEEPPVELHPHIAQRVKPHQVNGIQFMWREIIEDPNHHGCILAHTMGLGKTMQVVSLLVTISLCIQSDDHNVRNHIPPHLQENKTLILCPPSLLNNWEDELLMWTPDPAILGIIHKADSSRKQDNIRAITAWSKQGGVLLMGYERFRQSVMDSISAKDKGTVLLSLEEILLNEPSLVIADEAHMLKNAKSKISQIAKRIKTKSRIALSGSPLNNHLEEYHTMVDWIAPGYLGNIVQFRSKYSEPIMAGLYSDSSAGEKRLSLRKLHVLKRDLDPKINRADLSAIEKDMPSKTEYFITIPLTDLQRQAYDIYVGHMLQSFKLMSGISKGKNARIWDWIAMLSWLCHHPAAFVAKMKERDHEMCNQDNNTDPSDSTDETSAPDEVNEDAAPDVTGPMREAMHRALQILDASDRRALYDPSLSYRTLAVKRIVEKAIEARDKTLIFSHSIPTLNYLEQMLKDMKASFCRIDGQTKVSDRQAFTKEFNQKDNYQVFLISMRAGGLGLNLQGANRVVIFDFSFNPTREQQAIGRAYRLNQKRPVFVYRFQAGGTFEDKLFNTSVFKTQLFGRVVDKKNPRRHASKGADTEYLFPVRDIPQTDFSECLGKDPNVLDAIIHELDFIRSVVLTETFQKEDDEQLNDEDQRVAEEEYNDQRLQRENPEAWQAKQNARAAQQWQRQQDSTTIHSSRLSNSILHSTAPIPGPRASAVANRVTSSQYALVQPPFGREHLHALQRPQPVHTMSYVPGSYDDTFQAFP